MYIHIHTYIHMLWYYIVYYINMLYWYCVILYCYIISYIILLYPPPWDSRGEGLWSPGFQTHAKLKKIRSVHDQKRSAFRARAPLNAPKVSAFRPAFRVTSFRIPVSGQVSSWLSVPVHCTEGRAPSFVTPPPPPPVGRTRDEVSARSERSSTIWERGRRLASAGSAVRGTWAHACCRKSDWPDRRFQSMIMITTVTINMMIHITMTTILLTISPRGCTATATARSTSRRAAGVPQLQRATVETQINDKTQQRNNNNNISEPKSDRGSGCYQPRGSHLWPPPPPKIRLAGWNSRRKRCVLARVILFCMGMGTGMHIMAHDMRWEQSRWWRCRSKSAEQPPK